MTTSSTDALPGPVRVVAREWPDQAEVSLLPRGAPFVATFYAPGGVAPFDVYVDITTVPTWTGGGAADPRDTVTAYDGSARVWFSALRSVEVHP